MYLCETWESQAALDQILRQTIANPIGPEFMAPPARNTVAAQEIQSLPKKYSRRLGCEAVNYVEFVNNGN